MNYDGTLILGIGLSIVITGAYYMAPLLIYRFFIYKNRLPKDFAIKACVLSAILMYLIVFVLYITTGTDGVPNIKAAVLFFLYSLSRYT